MFFTRVGAAIFVLLIIGSFAFTGVAVASWLGPISAHGTHVLHTDGDVIKVGPGRDFAFKTANDQTLNFVCSVGCRASLRHLVRHVKENAHTDVYYVLGPNRQLIVVDVD